MPKIANALLFDVGVCSPGDPGDATTAIAVSTTSSGTKGPATTTADAPDTT